MTDQDLKFALRGLIRYYGLKIKTTKVFNKFNAFIGYDRDLLIGDKVVYSEQTVRLGDDEAETPDDKL